MKKGDKVMTPRGAGVIVDIEEYSRLHDKRFGVKLDDTPNDIPLYYWTHELTKL